MRLDSADINLVSVARAIGALPAAALLVLGILALGLGWVVTRKAFEQMRAEMQARIDSLEKQLDSKDAALERKDAVIQNERDEKQALVQGLIDKALPALARSALVLENWHTDTTVRRSE